MAVMRLAESRSKNVIYTCLFGYKEKFADPDYGRGTKCILFTDDPHLDPVHWEVVLVQSSVSDPARLSRRFKTLPDLNLSSYEKSIYVDNTVRLKVDPEQIFDELAAYEWVMVKHPWRDCIYDGAEVVAAGRYDNTDTIKRQMDRYRKNGYPPNNGLNARTFIFRIHHTLNNVYAGVEWLSLINMFSLRDQLSWNYWAWKDEFAFHTLDVSLTENRYFSWPHSLGGRVPHDLNETRYLELHEDVRQSGINPRWHYLNYRIGEERAYR